MCLLMSGTLFLLTADIGLVESEMTKATSFPHSDMGTIVRPHRTLRRYINPDAIPECPAATCRLPPDFAGEYLCPLPNRLPLAIVC